MKKIIALLIALAPVTASAQQISDFNSLVAKLTGMANVFIQILIAVAVIFIIWNVVVYLVAGGSDDDKRKTAGKAILWGVVGLFVILSIWGLVRILMNTFRTDTQAPVQNYPKIDVRI